MIDYNSKEIRERLEKSIQFLIEDGAFTSKAHIAREIDITPQSFNELLKGRVKLTEDFINKFCDKTLINPKYIIDDANLVYDIREGHPLGYIKEIAITQYLVEEKPIENYNKKICVECQDKDETNRILRSYIRLLELKLESYENKQNKAV